MAKITGYTDAVLAYKKAESGKKPAASLQKMSEMLVRSGKEVFDPAAGDNIQVEVTAYEPAQGKARENGLVGKADIRINKSVTIRDVSLYERETPEGIHFPSVSFPAYKDRSGEFHDFITGVSREVRALAAEAMLKADVYCIATGNRTIDQAKAAGTDVKEVWYGVRTYKAKEDARVEGMASIKVQPYEGAEKSLFTINNIRIRKSDRGYYYSQMPSVRKGGEFEDVVAFPGNTSAFVNNIVVADFKRNHVDKAVEEAIDRVNKQAVQAPEPGRERGR